MKLEISGLAKGVAAALIICIPLGAIAEETTLSAVSFVPPHTAFGKPFAEWAEKVNTEAKGKIKIDLKASGSMSPFTMGNAVKSGVVNMAYVPFTFYQNLLPVADALKMNRRTPQERRSNGTWEFVNKLHNEKVNAWYLGVIGMNVPFHIYLREKRITEPNLSGIKIRITPIYRAFFKALGADTLQTAPAEVYTALERGTIGGLGWPIWDIKSFGWDKHIKYRIDPGFYVTGQAFLVNLDKWKSLTNAQRSYLTKSAIEFEEYMWEKSKELNAFYRKQQAEAGLEVITFSPEQNEAFLNTAYEEGWAEAEKLDPINAPKLRALIYD